MLYQFLATKIASKGIMLNRWTSCKPLVMFFAAALFFAPCASSAGKASALDVVPDKTSTVVAPSTIHYDFGVANLLDQQQVRKIFQLKNDSPNTVYITKLQPGCGCTSGLILDGKAAIGQTGPTLSALKPGETASVQVTVDLTHLNLGKTTKSLLVFIEGAEAPAARLEISGTISNGIIFTPDIIDFGQSVAGLSKTVILSVKLDHRLVADSNKVLRITSSYPWMHIALRPLSGDNSALLATGFIERTYDLTIVSDAPLGPITGSISLDAKQLTEKGEKLESSALSSNISGEVTGDYLAQPAILAFGPVSARDGVAREVLIVGKSLSKVELVKASASDAWMTARIVRALSGAQTKQTLLVSIANGAPLGDLHSQLIIVLSDNQRIVIPVEAYVHP